MNTLEFIQIKCEQLAENKFFIGLMMIMVNIGARFIIEELTDEQRQIVKGDTFRMIVIFCSVFLATRDIVTALIITIILLIVVYFSAFVFNIFLISYGNNKNRKPLGIYTQIVEIISLIILNIWFII